MKQFTEGMHNLSGALMLIGQTLISAFFVIVILVLVLAVEIQRVAHGIQLFETQDNLAYLGAFVLVMMLLTLEFVIHYVEAKHGYEAKRQQDFSLRHFFNWLGYFLGGSKHWQPRLKSPAQEIKSYSRLLTITILALALGGSMSDALAQVSGNWISGLQQIALESTLLELVEWFGGLLFALALVVGAQRLTSYVAQRASETLVQAQTDNEVPVLPLETASTLENDAYIDSEINISDESDTEPQNMVAVCEDCGWESSPKPTFKRVRMSLNQHRKTCKKYQERIEVSA